MKKTGLAATGLFALLMQPGTALAAGGCIVGQIKPTPDASAISVFFDPDPNKEPSFKATPGSDARCALPPIPTQRPGGPETFSVYSADYRGFVAEGDTARITVEGGRSLDSDTVAGPVDGGVLLRTYVGTDGGDTLNSTTLLQLTQASDPDTYASIDSIDYALAAATTAHEIENSLDRLGSARTSVAVHLQTVAGLLTGINRPLDRPDEVRLIGAGGSYLAGVTGRWSLSDTLSLEGGAAGFGLSADDADAKGAMAAATLRTLAPAGEAWRPFAEGGLTLAPLRLRFARDYDDGTDDGASGTGSTHGFAGGVHATAGFLLQPDAANQIVLSATAAQDWLDTEGHAEDFGTDNLFAASFGSETTALTTLKLGTAWTTALTPAFDMTLNAAAGHGWAGGRLRADVSFAGEIDGSAQDDDFLEYGARFGFKPAPSFAADLFVQGATGRVSDTHLFWGGSAGYRF